MITLTLVADEGVKKMSDDDADDFIAFGKALKPLEDDAIIRKKPIAVEEQIGKFLQICTRV